ncbi:hypothetical protein SAMN06296386_10390 [Lachnospiraceae bacterium]|nr:hypothetical protein SAMN06296386_10390 [Lachnospiraceae bacterium]
MIMLRNTVSGKIVRFMLVEALLIMFFIITAGINNNIHAASISDSDKNELKSMFLQMLETTDTSEHDVSKYKIKNYTDLREIFEEVCKNEGELASICYTTTHIDTVNSKGYVSKVSLSCFENEKDFDKNYADIKETVDSILSGITDDMTDADKALYLHEALINRTTAVTNAEMRDRCEAGPLLFKRGNCFGYTLAYSYLLKRAGIESVRAYNKAHTWSVVKLDGEWYHVDVTWDDPISSADVDHKFFLRTDKEFQNDPVAADRHLNYTMKDSAGNNISATSTKYSDSFIHNVKNVGIMTFKDGYWQYSKDGKTYRGRLTDTEAQEVTEDAEDENPGSEAQEPADDEEEDEDEEDLSPWTMVIGAPAPSTPDPEPESEHAHETEAKFYLCKGDRTNFKPDNYISLGNGTITETEQLADDEDAILAALGEVPDYSSYLSDGQRVCWYSVKEVWDGWHVDGQIITDEEAQSSEAAAEEAVSEEAADISEEELEDPENEPESESEPAHTTTTAKFYICKGDRTNFKPDNFISLGNGTITKTERLADDEDAILAALGEVPDYSSYLSDGQRICWYSVKEVWDGWHVDGQIVSE